MKVSVSQPDLAQALSIVSHAVSGRSSMTILENILISTGEDRIILAATNMELGLRAWIPAQVEDEGQITLPSRTLTDLVNTLPAGNVTLTLNDANMTVTLTCAQSTSDIRGIEADEFPSFPSSEDIENVSFVPQEIKMQEMKKMITQVAFAAATDDNRPVLHGVKLSVEGNFMSMAATDGFRIAMKRIELEEGLNDPLSAIIPASAMKELARIATPADTSVQIAFRNNKSQIIFRLQNCELVASLIAGEYINYEAIVPTSFKTIAVVSSAALKKACDQCGVFARENKNLIRFSIQSVSGETGKIALSSTSESSGGNDSQVDCEITGDNIEIAFNVKYLTDALDAIGTQHVALKTNASMAPALITPTDETIDYRYVIMPMHFA